MLPDSITGPYHLPRATLQRSFDVVRAITIDTVGSVADGQPEWGQHTTSGLFFSVVRIYIEVGAAIRLSLVCGPNIFYMLRTCGMV